MHQSCGLTRSLLQISSTNFHVSLVLCTQRGFQKWWEAQQDPELTSRGRGTQEARLWPLSVVLTRRMDQCEHRTMYCELLGFEQGY